MKKIDKLILTSFLGPFILTFMVVVFILLMQHMLKYFDDIIGKDLGWDVLGTLLFYFAVFMTPVALPLAVLLSSLITFGNLGEHFELTAIKSLGVSLTRALIPIFGLVLLITLGAFLANNYLVPKAALEAYSLLYDIKQKKPSLDLREGAFYGAIPDVNIKVNKKYPDGITLEGVVIYDHRGRSGNREVTIADSGRMYTILNNRYLKLELFNGYNYGEGGGADHDVIGQPRNQETFSKTKFDKTYVIFDLSAFILERTDKKWFQSNRIMRNLGELDGDMDSVDFALKKSRLSMHENLTNLSSPLSKSFGTELPHDLELVKYIRDSSLDLSAEQKFNPAEQVQLVKKKELWATRMMKKEKVDGKKNELQLDRFSNSSAKKVDSIFKLPPKREEVSGALVMVRTIKSQLTNTMDMVRNQRYEFNIFRIQWHKILASSFACVAMFLIGAPLGAIIKRGGLGVPVLVSILFFIFYYVMSITGEKWAKQELITVPVGIWTPDFVLLIFGLLFLRQARIDARLFESDFYQVLLEKYRRRFNRTALANP